MKNFFVPGIVVFSVFLSISFPFKTSLTACFPSVPDPSVAVYVVRKMSLVGIVNEAPFSDREPFRLKARHGVPCLIKER